MELVPASSDDAIVRATSALDAGELIVLPGDLAYLLVADALDDNAVEHLFLATGRGADRPPLALIGGYADLHHVAYGGASVRALTDAHWPGPTTLVLRARPWLPDMMTAASERVRVSAPRGFAGELARHFGPLAAVGARRQGAREALDARAAAAALGADARLVVDGGSLPGGEPRELAPEEG